MNKVEEKKYLLYQIGSMTMKLKMLFQLQL